MTLTDCIGNSHSCIENELECQNGGVCEVKYGVSHCHCPDGYEGTFCQFFNQNSKSKTDNNTGNHLRITFFHCASIKQIFYGEIISYQ